MSRPAATHSARRRLATATVTVTAASLALTAAMVAGASSAAHADTVSVHGVQFRWGLNNESNNAAYAPGTFNFFSAGKIGDPGAGGQTLSDADQGSTWSNGATAGWQATDGNVTIEKEQPDGRYLPATWAGLKTAPDGSAVTVASTTFTGHQVVVNNGTGTLDPADDDADISWQGDFTALYYSGMTYFTVSDPHLVVTGGDGTITATLGGFAADMNDPTEWGALPDTSVTLATLSDVDVTDAGLVVTPDYVDVDYDAPEGATPQAAKTSANAAYWGSFPQSFVDFQQRTGSSSYWYASGGSADARKVTLPLQVYADGHGTNAISLRTAAATYGNPAAVTVTVPGGTGTVTLSGGGTDLSATLVDGAASFTLPAGLTVGDHPLTASYPGDANHAAATAIGTLTVVKAPSSTALSAPSTSVYGALARATVSVPGGSGGVTLDGAGATQSQPLVGGRATFVLPAGLAAGSHALTASYAGDATHSASSAQATVTVVPAGVRFAKVKVTKKPTAAKKGKVMLELTAATGVPVSGKVKLVLKAHKSRKKAKATVVNGKAVVKLPRLTHGKWKLKATYAGTTNLATTTATAKVKV